MQYSANSWNFFSSNLWSIQISAKPSAAQYSDS